MTAYVAAWTICMVLACVLLVALVVFAEICDHRAHEAARRQLDEAEQSKPAPAPRIPEQRQPTASAASVITVGDPTAYDAFLAELIITPHVEETLS